MKYLSTLVLLIAIFLSASQVMGQKSSGQSSDPAPSPSQKSEGNLLNVFIPNAFTPNMDGRNDYFKPVISGDEIDFYELVIIDRTGKEVFSSNDPSKVWNGTTPGSNYVSSSSLYVYFLKVK